MPEAIPGASSLPQAKKDVEATAAAMKGKYDCEAYTAVAKALVTQASSAIPVVPLYICLLYKVMKEKGNHEVFPTCALCGLCMCAVLTWRCICSKSCMGATYAATRVFCCILSAGL